MDKVSFITVYNLLLKTLLQIIDLIVLYAVFNRISFISRRQLTFFMSFLGFTSTRLRLSPTKNAQIRCRSKPGPLDYKSNTLPLSHAGLLLRSLVKYTPEQLSMKFTPYFCLSPLQKHVRKVVGGFGKKSCVSTGVRKPGNTCASPTAMI